MSKTLLVTGGAGFIGSNLVLNALGKGKWSIVNIDKLTYSGNRESLSVLEGRPDYEFIQADIGDAEAMRAIFSRYKPDALMNLAAESHVDRSIDSPEVFIDTNIKGVFVLLETARAYLKSLQHEEKAKASAFRFLHISTDEVFGDLADNSEEGSSRTFFNETTPYAPSSPYSASKAASDHLVRAWQRTYGLPALITNCSNNYGPRQFPEKLIPLTILNALAGKPLPVYGKGEQVRDWLYVDDHAEALLLALERGKPGDTFTVGGHNEKKNIEVVRAVCDLLDKYVPDKPAGITRYVDLISFVQDRPGHDGRYAIDPTRISSELGWKPRETFDSGLDKTVRWYLENESWWRPILERKYAGERLGVNI